MDVNKCAQCGTPATPGATFCESCGAPLAAKEAQPTSESQAQGSQAGGPTYNRASIGTAAYETPTQGPRLHCQSARIRFLAQFFDDFLLGAITFVLVALIIGGTAAVTSPKNISAAAGTALTSTAILVAIVVWFLYYTLLEGKWGQTLGKWFAKVKVVKEDGAPITYRDAAVRTILRVIDGLLSYLVGAVLIWTSDKKQRLGDRLAHTVVIQLCDVE